MNEKMLLKAEGVHKIYTTHIFPKRDGLGEAKMSRDLCDNLKFLGTSIGEMSGKHILDAGCGTGELSCFFSENGAHVTGIDFSESSLEYAEKLAYSKGLTSERMTFICGSLLSYEFSKKYDVVFTHMVLHHTADPKSAFLNMARALKPGGEIIFRVFTFWDRMAPLQKSPLWKLWVVRLLGGKSAQRRVDFAEKLFYKEGHERSHGLLKDTYLFDNYGVPIVFHHLYGELLVWMREAGIEYVSSNPPMEFARRVEPLLDRTRMSSTAYGTFLRVTARIVLALFPIHKFNFLKRPTMISRILSQAVSFLTRGGSAMITVRGIKRE